MYEKKFLNRWSKIRKYGIVMYMLLIGICGGSGGFVFTGGTKFFTTGYIGTGIWGATIGGFAGGAIGAYIDWKKKERKYENLINQSKL